MSRTLIWECCMQDHQADSYLAIYSIFSIVTRIRCLMARVILIMHHLGLHMLIEIYLPSANSSGSLLAPCLHGPLPDITFIKCLDPTRLGSIRLTAHLADHQALHHQDPVMPSSAYPITYLYLAKYQLKIPLSPS